jgi:hypothetical protein
MSDVKPIIAVASNPVRKGEGGEAVEGWYTRDGDTLTLTDRDGTPLRNEDTGARYTQSLEPGDVEKVIAARLTMRHHRAQRGDEMASFHSRRLEYPSRGWA